VSAERVREIEPHVRCIAGLLVKSTGITSYTEVCRKFLELIEAAGGEVSFGQSVRSIQDRGSVKIIGTETREFEARFVINCAGLHSDRVARMAGADPGARIVPFRGEYFELVPEKRHLVNTLIYPVPNPDFPFLGVHFTKMIGGSVHAGPNAVLALKREGYFKTDFNLRDFSETMAFPGFWKLISKNLGEGLKEMHRSFFKLMAKQIPSLRLKLLSPPRNDSSPPWHRSLLGSFPLTCSVSLTA
jgi:L-2-hydroxyglutarate oxidase